MGYDVGGTIGYGFMVPEEKFSEETKPEGMEFVFAGDSGFTEVFLCITDTIQGSGIQTTTKLDLSKLSVLPEQHQRLLDFAKELKIKKPEIGWWLCASGG